MPSMWQHPGFSTTSSPKPHECPIIVLFIRSMVTHPQSPTLVLKCLEHQHCGSSRPLGLEAPISYPHVAAHSQESDAGGHARPRTYVLRSWVGAPKPIRPNPSARPRRRASSASKAAAATGGRLGRLEQAKPPGRDAAEDPGDRCKPGPSRGGRHGHPESQLSGAINRHPLEGPGMIRERPWLNG